MFEVIFARKVFPIWTKWHKRFYDPTNPDTAYETFVSGTQAIQQRRGLEWHVPASGQFLVLDRLMDALENGVRDALARSYLSKVDLSFHSIDTEPMCESNCIESYGLHISYGPANMPYIDTELRTSRGSQTTSMNVLQGKTSLKDMINGIAHHFLSSEQAKVFKTLPLPDNIRVSLQAEYTAQTPPDYQPLGFKPVREIAWKKNDMVADENDKYKLTTGFHSVAFTFRPPGYRVQAPQSSQQDNDPAKRIAPGADDGLRNERSIGSLRAVDRLRASSEFSASDGGHTQPEILRQVRGIHFSRLDHDSRQDTQQYHTSPSSPSSIPPYPDTAFHAELYIPQYVPEILEVARLRLKELVARSNEDLATPQSVQIYCDCGVSVNDGHLVQCLQCHTFHHAECYGYLSKVPRAEFCYACARDLFDKSLNLGDRKFDAQLRRTIRFFQNGQVARTLNEIAMHLGMGSDERSKSVTRQILDDLATDGYIVERKVDSTFSLVIGKESIIPSTFFNPRIGIYHFFPENETPLIESTSPFRSIERPESYALTSASDYPRTPAASYPPKQYRTLRTMQHSSQREVSVDDATTQSAVSTPTHLPGYSSQEHSFSNEFRTLRLGGTGNGSKFTTPLNANSSLLREYSGNKRLAESGQQARASRRKME
ncbi:DNA binding protein [Cadophora gregata]|uniref:DNA binding protein n=1 Tax=Cadophora gregata TaxID=51156 RepID=UPI0026DAF2F1|nr:DNA binding protein [Cadophora gregata]KAK0124317.1 DNA binding protein [Cadophora gregata]